MIQDRFSRYRMMSMLLMAASTLAGSGLICLLRYFYVDAWICVFFLDLIFLMIYFFQIEYERLKGNLQLNTQTSLRWLAMGYLICCFLTAVFSVLPLFFKPVFLLPVLMCAFGNEVIAVTSGCYFAILLCLNDQSNLYELMAYILFVILVSALCKTLHEKRYRLYMSFLFATLPLVITVIFYYWCYQKLSVPVYFYGAISGIVLGFMVYFAYDFIRTEGEESVIRQEVNIIADNYIRVQEIRAYSSYEYSHARWVSELCGACARALGLNEYLCAAAGFYYRMGKWVGEPHVENGVTRAVQLCFPDEVQQILAEYRGEQRLPSTKESAIVHMVDALVIKMEALQEQVASSKWNHDMMIYQTLSELSSAGVYDESGLSINEYIRARDFLRKEVI